MTDAQQIRQWTQGTWLTEVNPESVITELVIDTRKVNTPAEALFIALKTNARNGHDFIINAYEKGIRNFLVQENGDTGAYPDSNFILVKDTRLALQQMAIAHRRQFDIPVIGITGSNGKTIVKEWLYHILHQRFQVVRSPMSYNSQLGVPLSVWLMQPEHNLAIFEAGISQAGEMEKLERIIQPTIGIFTNIGEAHSEGFLNQRQKILEKLVLFRNARQLVYCKDHLELHECIIQYRHQIKNERNSLQLFTWSARGDADLRITNTDHQHGSTTIHAIYSGQNCHITIPFSDPASIENAIQCWCAALLLGLSQEEIQLGMKSLQPVAMRLELLHGINDCTIINDTYNSDLTSLLVALDYLDQQKQHSKRTVILSDMLQMGQSDAQLYEYVAEMVGQRNIQRFIGVGPALHRNKQFFRQHKKLRSIFFKSTEELLQQFHLLSFSQEAILLKGARRFEFEKLGKMLEDQVHQTVLSVNLSAITHNLNVFRSLIQPGTKVMAMVKAFSYGSGSFEIAHLLQHAGVDYLSVAYTDEGVELRKAGITLPIMVMSPDVTSFDRMIAWKLEPELYNLRSLRLFLNMAANLKVRHYPVHIKVDSGMHRLGFESSDLPELIDTLRQSDLIEVRSIFSHLAASDSSLHDDFTREQARRFQQMSGEIEQVLPNKPLLHLCNSAAIARHAEWHFDMVRVGLGLYGIDGSHVLESRLKQVSTLKTTIAQIKTVLPGETIGYNRQGVVHTTMRIATISIGYADGYPRSLGNGVGYVLIQGHPAPTVGIVCMDMCMVDISKIPDVKEGDEVLVFAPELPITQLAAWAGTIPYELMTGISQRVKRVYVNES